MSCEKIHTRKQTAVIEGSCGCVVILFDCSCKYLERSCNYLAGTMRVGITRTDLDVTPLVEKHIEKVILRRVVDVAEEIPNVRDFRDGP